MNQYFENLEKRERENLERRRVALDKKNNEIWDKNADYNDFNRQKEQERLKSLQNKLEDLQENESFLVSSAIRSLKFSGNTNPTAEEILTQIDKSGENLEG